MKTILTYAVEAFHHSKKAILTFWAALAAIWGVFNSLLSQETGWNVLAIISIIGILYAIWKYSVWFYHIVKGRMTVPFFGKRKTTLLRNDYQENMDYLLHQLSSQKLDKFAFVMGIDMTGDLSISSEGGVVYSVLKYLNENYMCVDEKNTSEPVKPIDYIQKSLNEHVAKCQAEDPSYKLNYGVCVEVSLNLRPINATDTDSAIPCNLILTANSRKEVPNDKNMEERMLDDNQSNIIVPNVFDYLMKTSWYEGVMIGVMGTNGMRQSYQVIFSQIINQFARVCYKDSRSPLESLYISIREKDYNNSHMSLSNLERYVRQCAEYYSTWAQE